MAEIPAWAIERVAKIWTEALGGDDIFTPANVWASALGRAFASYLAAHESEPVDPLLRVAREIVAFQYEAEGLARMSASTKAGNSDDSDIIKATLTALRRGIELAKEQTP